MDTYKHVGKTFLHNDVNAGKRVLAAARTGSNIAQYAAGMMYAEGRGVIQNMARAYMWLKVAEEQGNNDARMMRYQIAHQLSQRDLIEANNLLEKFKTKQQPKEAVV